MRRLLASLAIAGIGVALAPAASNAQATTQDSVTGIGGTTTAGFSAFVGLDATSGPSGEDPTGTVTWHLGGGLGPTWRGNVSCLSVSGNTAIIGFGGSYVTQLPQVYWVAGLVRAVDVGPGPGDTFEWVELATSEPGVLIPPEGDPLPGPTDCSSFPAADRLLEFGGPSPGNIVVTDAVDSSRTCAGRAATVTGSGTVVGTAGDDVIVGSDGDDTILGLGGNDVICARGGNDRVYAGADNDTVLGGDGEDLIRGGPGDDWLIGQAGNDRLLGLQGGDLLIGQEADDSLLGGPGDDLLDGGAGVNSCSGGPGANTLTNCGPPTPS